MTTIQLNNGLTLFPYKSTSYFQSFKQKFWTPSSTLLLNELKEQESLSYPTLLKVVAFLADHPHSQLEQILKKKLSQATPFEALLNIQSVNMFSLLHGHLKMLDVCQRIISLDQLSLGLNVKNIVPIAQREALITPKPTRKIQKVSDSIVQNWQRYSGIFGKIINCFHAIIMGTITTVGVSLLYPLDNPPSSIMEVQGYFQVYRYVIDGFTLLKTSYLGFFSTMKMAAQVGILILISAYAINYIHKRFHLGIPDKIDKREYFQNTSIDAQNGKIKKIKGRYAERELVRTAWNVAPGEKFRIALLVGPTGCGKTEFVKGLAWESMNNPDSFVFRKKIFMINTIKLVQEGSYYLDKVLKGIEGHEDDVVLFFDEGHSAGSQEGKIGPLIESLKTALLDKNIRGVFATTNKEYEDNIEHNQAFVDRCLKIDFQELSDAESKKILTDKVHLDQECLIEVDADAYDELLAVARTNPKRYNPRKVIDLYKDVRSYVYGWEPKALKKKLDLLTTERDDLSAACRTANNDPNWSNSSAGKELLNELQKKEKEVMDLIIALKNQNLELQKIARLRALQPHYRQRYQELVHRIAAQENSGAPEQLQKEFLYLKYILNPALKATLENEAERLSTLYQDELPLKIDAALIRKCYPASCVTAPLVSTTLKPLSLPLICTTNSASTDNSA